MVTAHCRPQALYSAPGTHVIHLNTHPGTQKYGKNLSGASSVTDGAENTGWPSQNDIPRNGWPRLQKRQNDAGGLNITHPPKPKSQSWRNFPATTAFGSPTTVTTPKYYLGIIGIGCTASHTSQSRLRRNFAPTLNEVSAGGRESSAQWHQRPAAFAACVELQATNVAGCYLL